MGLLFKVRKTIEKEALIQPGDRVLVCVSGGIDSTTLFFLLHEITKHIGFKLGIAHVNHGLRGIESDRDECFVEDLAHKFSIPFFKKRYDVGKIARARGISVQHAGREIRYEFFEHTALLNDFNKIAIGHTADDQVETFFLRILKGTGIKGLSAIPVKRGIIIRPLLNVYRSEIETYVRENLIDYVHDSSNDKIYYERNYIRKELVPVIERFNSQAKKKVIKLLEEIGEINRMFELKAEQFITDNSVLKGEEICFPVDRFKHIDDEVRFRATLFALEKLGVNLVPLREHMRLIKDITASERPNLQLSLPKGVKVKKTYGTIIFSRKQAPGNIEERFPVYLGENISDRFGLKLYVSEIKEGTLITPVINDKNTALIDGKTLIDMHLRTFKEGDRFYPLGMKQPVKLKDFFISQKIPKELRRSIPLLVANVADETPPREDILWVVGYRIDERYKIKAETKRIIKIEVQGINRWP